MNVESFPLLVSVDWVCWAAGREVPPLMKARVGPMVSQGSEELRATRGSHNHAYDAASSTAVSGEGRDTGLYLATSGPGHPDLVRLAHPTEKTIWGSGLFNCQQTGS